MRHLSFSPDDAALYQVAHVSLTTAPPTRTAGESRLLGKLLDIVEAIGIAEPVAPHFKLSPSGGTVAFEDAEFAAFVSFVGQAAIMSHAIRQKIALLDRLDAAPSVAP